MNLRTRLRAALADPLHPLCIGLAIVLATVAMHALEVPFLRMMGWGNEAAPVYHELPLVQPAVLAGGIEVAEGILQFNGHSARGVWSGQVTSALLALLFLYVIGPGLLVWGLLARMRYRDHQPVRGGATAVILALAIGGCSVVMLLPAPVYAIASNTIHAAMVRDSESSAVRDGLDLELYLMARKAQVRFFSSASGRWQRHSWMAKDGSGRPAIRIEDLVDTFPGRAVQDTAGLRIGDETYTLHVDRCDSITIVGTIPWRGFSFSEVKDSHPVRPLRLVMGVTPETVHTVLE